MFLSRNIWFLVTGFCILLLSSGCSSENITDELSEIDKDEAILVLHVRALDDGASDVNEIKEAVKSLRIIMIDENNGIECNSKIQLQTIVSESSDNEIYYFFRVTKAGKKRFYLFANEETVTGINDNADKTLTDFFDDFDENEGDATEFEKGLNNIYFTPEFKVEDNKVYLPYSSFYELDMNKGEKYENAMYLVPAATKFTFNFFNYRNRDVSIDKLAVTGIASSQFIMPHVNPEGDDYFKMIDDEEFYWIDWLAITSDESWEHPGMEDNQSFNKEREWISDYRVPQNAYTQEFYEEEDGVPEQTLIESFTQEHQIPRYNLAPGRMFLGPYYLMESKFLFREYQDGYDGKPVPVDAQKYNIFLSLKDVDAEESYDVLSNIGNLNALFRATHTVVNITMYNSTDIGVYGEIQGWNSTSMKGYLIEETAK